MWNVAAFDKGEWGRLSVFESTGVPPSTGLAIELAEELLDTDKGRALEYMRSEVAPVPGLRAVVRPRAAIESWSKDAETEFLEFNVTGNRKLEALEEALAYYSAYSPAMPAGSVPDALAWHDRTLVVIPIAEDSQELAIEYVPDLRDENRIVRMQRHATAEHKLETIFEWRGYFGRQSAVVDGWNTMRRRGRNFFATVRAKGGLLVGFVLRRLSRPQKILDRDPSYPSRLALMTAQYPDVAKEIPDLSTIPAVQRDAVLVFVHGTMSCGIQNLKDLHPLHIRIPTFRYEHDTFRPLQENGAELAELISSRVQAKTLYVVGHSRGGLVARVAVEKLRRIPYAGPISLHTFGTPHLGTPLAQIGARLLNLLFKIGGDIAGAIPVVSPLASAFSYVIDMPGFPPGLDVMREDSDALALLNEIGDPTDTECWASEFDMNAGPSGFGVELEGVLTGSLGAIPNDLVVPASSALAFGTPHALLNCSHVHYFGQPQVQNFFDSLPGPAAVGLAQAAAVSKPGRSKGPEIPPPSAIYSTGVRHIFVGGVRASKRP
jgi:hypothetical protein